MSGDWFNLCAYLRRTGTPHVVVTLVDARGSTPSDAGSRMVVTRAGHAGGTVGGGRVEAKAIALATRMVTGDLPDTTRFEQWNLQRDVGMTCGGTVTLFFESVHCNAWPIVIFGAGHVTQALARLLVTLPCHVRCIDPRRDWLEKLPDGVETSCTDDPPAEVAGLADSSFVLCMTRGHATDRPVLEAVFRQEKRFPFLGVIGSKSKAAVLRRELNEAGIAPRAIRFRCPVGLPIGRNHPGEIAVSIAAQLLEQRDAPRALPSDADHA